MPIQTIIADDEVLARRKLRQLLSQEPDIEIAGEGSSASDVIDLVQIVSPQLLFLDIRMPGMDGLDLVSKLSSDPNVVMPHIIFTTAYDQYALRAFEIHAIDYLLKPFTSERLQSAVQRVRDQILLAQRSTGRNQRREREDETYATRIVFKSRGSILFLPVPEIRWIAAEENYVRICTGSRNASAARDDDIDGAEARSKVVSARPSFSNRESALCEGSPHRIARGFYRSTRERTKGVNEPRLSFSH